MLVTIVAIIAVAVAAVVWMLTKPDDLPFSELMTWLTPIIGGATSLFTGANLYEHHKKSSSPSSSTITLAVPFGLLLLLLGLGPACRLDSTIRAEVVDGERVLTFEGRGPWSVTVPEPSSSI